MAAEMVPETAEPEPVRKPAAVKPIPVRRQVREQERPGPVRPGASVAREPALLQARVVAQAQELAPLRAQVAVRAQELALLWAPVAARGPVAVLLRVREPVEAAAVREQAEGLESARRQEG
jgi:hypothetical protein